MRKSPPKATRKMKTTLKIMNPFRWFEESKIF